MSQPSNVFDFTMKPKTLNKQYKKTHYQIKFIPESGEWQWTVKHVQETSYTEVAPTQIAAMRAAEKFIDKMEG